MEELVEIIVGQPVESAGEQSARRSIGLSHIVHQSHLNFSHKYT